MAKSVVAIIVAPVVFAGCDQASEGGAKDTLAEEETTRESREEIGVDETGPPALDRLNGDELVLAVARGGGGPLMPDEEFFANHHGSEAVYVFGDGTVTYLDEGNLQTGGYRVYRTYLLPSEAVAELLSMMDPSMAKADDKEYVTCECVDCPGESVYLELPSLAITSTAYPSFSGMADCEARRAEDDPPEALVLLVEELFGLANGDGDVVETEEILLGGFEPDQPVGWEGCDVTAGHPWPCDTSPFPDEEPGVGWSMALQGNIVPEVRAFIRDNLVETPWSKYSSACVDRNGVFYRVYYDDVLPGEPHFPF